MTHEEWRGDVHDGVAAWIRRASPSADKTVVEEVAPAPDTTVVEEVSDKTVVEEVALATVSRPPTRRRKHPTRWPDKAPKDPVADGPDADPESVARTILLDQLTGRARSRSELADKLASKNVPDDVASRLLDRFEEVGLVDDDAFARAWVSGRQSAKGLARRAIAQELRRKGVDDEVAREALDELDPADEEEAARLLVRKKLRTLSRVDDTTATRRLVGMLARKGYGAGQAYSIVRDELASSGREAPDPD